MRLSYGKQGIGPNSWGILRYLLPYNKLFHGAAVLHDNLYYISYNKQRADDMFYRAMLGVSHNSLQRIFARIYYFLVKNFGFLFYN